MKRFIFALSVLLWGGDSLAGTALPSLTNYVRGNDTTTEPFTYRGVRVQIQFGTDVPKKYRYMLLVEATKQIEARCKVELKICSGIDVIAVKKHLIDFARANGIEYHKLEILPPLIT
jgi:hypothetical protein